MPGGGLDQGTISVTERHDAFVGAATAACAGSLAVAESRDLLAASGIAADDANLAATDHHDAFAAAGINTSSGSVSAVESPDGFAGDAGPYAAADIAVTESHDVFAGGGGHPSAGDLVVTETRDAFAGDGRAQPPYVGMLFGREHRDGFAVAGTNATSGAIVQTERQDVFAGAGGPPSTGTITATERHDVLAGRGGPPSFATLAATDQHDLFAGTSGVALYQIFSNTGIDDPINYSYPIATVNTLTWTSNPLAIPGTWAFGVRAMNLYGEEQNLDCQVEFTINSGATDITNVPPAPFGLRGFGTANSGVRLEWVSAPYTRVNAPTGYHVYWGTTGAPSYGTIRATVLANSSLAGTFVANLAGLTSGTEYWFGVRAYNSTGEETNTNSVAVTPSGVGPAAVVDLTATLIT